MVYLYLIYAVGNARHPPDRRGHEAKPQAFDVYSPKILASISGLEDILALCCIAIPIRRTDQKMPCFPPDFDGAGILLQVVCSPFDGWGGLSVKRAYLAVASSQLLLADWTLDGMSVRSFPICREELEPYV